MTTTTETPHVYTVSNPHRVPTVITGIAALATLLGSLHGISTAPEQVGLVAGANVAALALFLANLIRHDLYDNNPPTEAFKNL